MSEETLKTAESFQVIRSLRYFIIAGVAGILLSTIIIFTLVSVYTNNLVLHKNEQHAHILAAHLNYQVMVRFIMPTIHQYAGIKMGDREQAELLNSIVRNTTHSFNVKRINILDLSGGIIYSTDPEYIGRIIIKTEHFLQATTGQSVSFIDPPQRFYDFSAKDERVFKTFSPLRDDHIIRSELGEPKAIFEIIMDINDDLKEVWLNQIILITALLLLMISLVLILYFIAKRSYHRQTDR